METQSLNMSTEPAYLPCSEDLRLLSRVHLWKPSPLVGAKISAESTTSNATPNTGSPIYTSRLEGVDSSIKTIKCIVYRLRDSDYFLLKVKADSTP